MKNIMSNDEGNVNGVSQHKYTGNNEYQKNRNIYKIQ